MVVIGVLLLQNKFMSYTIHTLSEYFALDVSRRERKVWYWPTKWYIEPYALQMEEWDKFHAHIQKEYPIQYFIRDVLLLKFITLKRKLRELKSWIKYRVNHPRKQIIKSVFIPEYQDLDSIIVKFCLACIVEYVEKEKCFEHIVWDSDDNRATDANTIKEIHTHSKYIVGFNNEDRATDAHMIKEIYTYAKCTRPLLLQEIQMLWKSLPDKVSDMKEYDPINLKEQEVKDLDTKWCTWVVTHRDRLWT